MAAYRYIRTAGALQRVRQFVRHRVAHAELGIASVSRSSGRAWRILQSPSDSARLARAILAAGLRPPRPGDAPELNRAGRWAKSSPLENGALPNKMLSRAFAGIARLVAGNCRHPRLVRGVVNNENQNPSHGQPCFAISMGSLNPMTGNFGFIAFLIFSQPSLRFDRCRVAALFEIVPSKFSLACSNGIDLAARLCRLLHQREVRSITSLASMLSDFWRLIEPFRPLGGGLF